MNELCSRCIFFSMSGREKSVWFDIYLLQMVNFVCSSVTVIVITSKSVYDGSSMLGRLDLS